MPRYLVTERTAVDADTPEQAIERAVHCSKAGYPEVVEQSATEIGPDTGHEISPAPVST